MADLKPDAPSGDYAAMKPYWDMVEAILGGAARMRAAGEAYLPRFINETREDYEYRRKNAKFTNVYRDIVENLASKPFSKEVDIVSGSASASVDNLKEDIDGQGNHLHVFAGNLFFQGINDAIGWIFVDKAPVPANASRADEKRIGARPYWLHIPAKRMLAVYSGVVAGQEVFVHARILEPVTARDGYGEKTVNRVRVLNRDPIIADGKVVGYGPATFELYEEREAVGSQQKGWVKIDGGAIAIGEIAIVPFVTGRRIEGTWRFVPPMQDAAYLQIEHYQQETNLKSIKEQACFPMLAGNGVSPQMVPNPLYQNGNGEPPTVAAMVPVGPKSVLYAPPRGDGASHGSWEFIEPSSGSLKFLADDVAATERQLRELGRQPLTAQTGNLTVVTAAFAAQKGNTAIQAWALNLKDALEQALVLTCKWLGDSSEPEVFVHTDFAIDMESDKAPDVLMAMRKNGDISRDALIVEAKRRDWLSPEYDADKDAELIAKEQEGLVPEQDIDPVTGQPIDPAASLGA